ncbi:MAG: hypothetical protein DI526_12965 [Caulobacter segnis]|uniref:Uncharacterized protein n=1 Tax=Caulobacter segnis TaxID=88688 RepID=A0A2W5WIJ9_9CAUL|nr:hypothetical protein [Caulobacter segnis]PZR33588.1 MAG: hypothetical protein DI526_12965 [Caulobacter segnis]
MDKALLIQLGGSVVAVALLVAIAAWLGVARPTPPLDAEAAGTLLALEFPDHRPEAVWISADGSGLIARANDEALLIWRRGDGYVAREAAWSAVSALRPSHGRLSVRVGDGAPVFAVADDVWPPKDLA